MDLVIAGFSLIGSAPSAQAAGGADTVSATPEALFAQLLDQLDGSPAAGDTEAAARGSRLAARTESDSAARGSRLAARTESDAAARFSLLAGQTEADTAARGPLLAGQTEADTAARGPLLAARTESETAARDEPEVAVGEQPDVSVWDSAVEGQLVGVVRTEPDDSDVTTIASGDEDREDERAAGEDVAAPVMWQSLPVAPQLAAPPPGRGDVVVAATVPERVEAGCSEVEFEAVSAADVRAERETDRVGVESRRPETERRELPQAVVDFAPGVSPVESAPDVAARAVTTEAPPAAQAARALARALASLAPEDGSRPAETVGGNAQVAQPAPLQQLGHQDETGQSSPGENAAEPRVTPKGAELAAALHRVASTTEGEVASGPTPQLTSSKAEPRHRQTFEPKPDLAAGLPAVPHGSAVEASPLPAPASVPTTPQMPHAVGATSTLAAREPTPPIPEEADIVPQLVRAMRTHFRAGVGEARIRLNPEHLGEVRLSIRIDGDRVSALLQVERPEVQKAIESQSDSLRTGLAAQGFTLEHLSVNRDEPPRQSANNEPEQRGRERGQPPPQRRARKRGHDQEFELAED